MKKQQYKALDKLHDTSKGKIRYRKRQQQDRESNEELKKYKGKSFDNAIQD